MPLEDILRGLGHPQMRVGLTMQVLPPWAVQDATCAVMEIDLSARDMIRMTSSKDSHIAAEMVLEELPHCVYVKLDKCNREFLPALKCQKHAISGFCKDCSACRSFEGWVLVQPLCKQVQRTQLPSCLKQHAPSTRCKGPHAIQG